MKKIILLLWVALLPITFSFAQTEVQKQEAYNQVKEWAVVKLTIAYMEDFRTDFDRNKETTDIKGSQQKEFITYKKLVEEYSDFTSEVNLDNISEILINGDWENAEKAVLKIYRQEIIENVDKNMFDEIVFAPKNISSFNASKGALEEIQKKYDELLNDIESVAPPPEDEDEPVGEPTGNGETGKELPPVEDTKTQDSTHSLWLYIVSGVLLLSVVLNILLFFLNSSWSKTKSELKKEIKNLEKKLKNKTNGNQSYSRASVNEIEKLRHENSDLRRKIESFELHKVAEQKTSFTKETISQPIEMDVREPTKITIYLPSPFQDSAFANEDANIVKTPSSIYKVDFDEQSQTGVLSVIEDADFSKALNSPDSYLETACIYDNEYNHKAKSIKVIENGEIKRTGEDWIVTKKVRIKFI